jgi:CubicO group peptidase (beta-lactamase class C family)
MNQITRRTFSLATGAILTQPWKLAAAGPWDAILAASVQRHGIPAAIFLTTNGKEITYSSTHGKRDSASSATLPLDSIFSIASMTKAITTTAMMQLVEQGKVKLDVPAGQYHPDLKDVPVFEGVDAAGKARLRAAKRPVTIADLITHTSGFAYDTWDANMTKYTALPPAERSKPVLSFDPGSRWQYGNGTQWAGRIVEKVTGKTLEQYMQDNILGPLGMVDTSYILKPEKFSRLVSTYNRQPDGKLVEGPRTQPAAPAEFNGDGGLFCTAPDYAKFTQMILNNGKGSNGTQILKSSTVAQMKRNQTGKIKAGVLTTQRPPISDNVDFHKGADDRYSFGFLLNESAYQGGRSAGSLAWAGIFNTFYWIDPKRNLAGVAMMHFLPFVDKEAVAVLTDFERAVYAR